MVVTVVATGLFGSWVAPREEVPAFCSLYLVHFGLVVAGFFVARARLEQLSWRDFAILVVLIGAALRLATVFSPTSLSDDVFRYVWDGHVTLAGINPYQYVPSELVERGLLSDETLTLLNSPDYYSVYPPLAQAFFAACTGLADMTGLSADRLMRACFGLVDLLTIALLISLLRQLGRSRTWAVFYAWNPFVVWEVVGGGHSEALMLPFVVLALTACVNGRALSFGVFIGLAGLSKLTCLLLAPVMGWYLLRRHGVRSAALAAVTAFAVVGIGYTPFLFDGLLDHHQDSFALYDGVFIFNAPLFDIARSMLGYQEGVTPDVADQIVPWFKVGVLSFLLVATLAVNGKKHRLFASLTAVSMTAILLSSVFHPWYLLLPLLVGVVAQSVSVVALSGLVVLSYFAYDGSDGNVPKTVMWIQFAPFAAALTVDVFRARLSQVLRRRAHKKVLSFAEFLSPSSTVLDIGAGEGFVAMELSRAGHKVDLIDVAPYNRTELPFRLYDGQKLPFDSNAFDVGVLCYVLHHCEYPDVVLDEACRVCRRLVVLESTYENGRQLKLLTFLDHLANGLRGIPIRPLCFRTEKEWRNEFEKRRLRLVSERWLGRWIHKRLLFVVEANVPSDVGQQTDRRDSC